LQPVTTAGAIANTTTAPVNYQTKVPALNFTAALPAGTANRQAKYYWVCLRRPANPFAPVSITNPMVVVDSMRFPYTDGTGATITTDAAGNPATAGPWNTLYSVQRFQPYRGGHAVPVPTPPGAPVVGAGVTSTPVDSRYGYTEQIVVPTINNILAGSLQTRGIYYKNGAVTNFATTPIFHTLGWANEYEQGSTNPAAEPWDYLPFHDRDFTGVAELMLVPGCPPGLFTKQFVEFAPSQANASIFTAVMPLATPPVYALPWPTPQLPATAQGGGGIPGGPAAGTAVEAYFTASTPLLYTNGYAVVAPFAATTPYQPHTYPYLNDEFFYSGYGGLPTIDPTGQVGGYAADGWFKMFEFFEVPSQAFGAIGPVASGANFDWLRQDIKPGQLNLNMIIDEEVFLSLTGKQNIAQSSVQVTDANNDVLVPSDQFTEQLLNFDQIAPLGPIPGSNPPSWSYTLPVATALNPTPFMLPVGANPIPLVVTSTLANGSPGTAYPIAPSYSFTGGVLDQDQITNTVYGLTNNANTNNANIGPGPLYNNSLKAAWVQFLTLRHGGSGYLFGFGTGSVGQNYAVTPVTPPQTLPLANNLYGTGIPKERPFHSLSYPDIDYTIMRPAALPPSAYTNPAYNGNPTVIAALPGVTTYYAGDPGVRNPTLFLPYPSSSGIPSGTAPNFPGMLPTNYVTPPGAVPLMTPWGTLYDPVYPSAIPVRRLFQFPDVYTGSAAAVPPLTVPNGPSNAGETGDPYINNQSPINATGAPLVVPYSAPGAFQPPLVAFNTTPPITYAEILTNSVVNLYQPGKHGTSLIDPTGANPTVHVNSPNGNIYLGSNGADKRQHPYWRTEQLQRVMNLTTTRTHQYAVWITIGFFEVKRQGDLGMLASNPQLAFDILGPEIGAANGKNTRYRGFYLVDRLQLTGFNPSSPSAFRSAVVYRQRIQ